MANSLEKSLRILGTRGIPGRHGGFESFAEDLAPFLVARGWAVTVYCQEQDGHSREDWWRGVRLMRLPVSAGGARGTIAFDWKTTRHAMLSDGLVLVLGYNTAVFNLIYRLRGIPNVLNMDGLEWRRQKYNLLERGWLLMNEWVGCRTADHLVADHPAIHERYTGRRGVRGVTTVPYGSRAVQAADARLIARWNLTPNRYTLVIARPEPENSILEIVRAYSMQRRRCTLVVLGSYDRAVRYQRRVLEAAGPDVLFPGAVYDRAVVDALRYFATLYIHGHRVGGTNPSLVEALGASTPVVAHDNRFNRWVCGDAAVFFRDERDLASALDRLLPEGGQHELSALRHRARIRHSSTFDLERRLGEYEQVLLNMLGETARAASRDSGVDALSGSAHGAAR